MKKKYVLVLTILLLIGLFGCSQDNDIPNNDVSDNNNVSEYTFGDTFEFDGFEITFMDNYDFSHIDNEYSDNNGDEIVIIPVKIKNVSDATKDFNTIYIDIFGLDGVEIDHVGFYVDDSLQNSGDLRSGAEAVFNMPILYSGNGDYYLQFDNGYEKLEVKLPITKNWHIRYK